MGIRVRSADPHVIASHRTSLHVPLAGALRRARTRPHPLRTAGGTAGRGGPLADSTVLSAAAGAPLRPGLPSCRAHRRADGVTACSAPAPPVGNGMSRPRQLGRSGPYPRDPRSAPNRRRRRIGTRLCTRAISARAGSVRCDPYIPHSVRRDIVHRSAHRPLRLSLPAGDSGHVSRETSASQQWGAGEVWGLRRTPAAVAMHCVVAVVSARSIWSATDRPSTRCHDTDHSNQGEGAPKPARRLRAARRVFRR